MNSIPVTTEMDGLSRAAGESVDGYASATDIQREPPPKQKSSKLQFIWTVGFAFAIVGLQLGQGILLARLLGPQGRGEYAAAVLYTQLLLYIGLLGGLEVICRAATSGASDLLKLRRSALRLGVTTGTITMVVVILLNLFALPAAKMQFMPLALLCSLSLVGQHVMLIMTAVDRGSGEFGKYNARRFVAAAAFPAVLLITTMVTQVSVEIACWLFVLASLISMATCLIGVPKPFLGKGERTMKDLLDESRPYGLSMLATDLFERLDLLLVLWLAPIVQQGFYTAMAPAVYPLTVIPNTLGLFLFNAGADNKKRLTHGDVHRIIGSSVAVQAAMTIGFMILIGPVVTFLYGPKFQPAIVYALWLAPASAIKGILQGLDSYLKGRGRPLAPVRARSVAMLVMIVATILLFPKFGTLAIAIAALLGQVLCFIWLIGIVYADVASQEDTEFESTISTPTSPPIKANSADHWPHENTEVS